MTLLAPKRAPLLAGIALLPLLTGCTAVVAAKPTPTTTLLSVSGTVAVPVYGLLTGAADGVEAEGDTCRGDDGYDDIAAGSQVVVSDAAGKTLAIGSLEAGTFTEGKCQFPFTVSDVPLGSKFYGLHVGNTNRGTLQYTKADLEAGPALSIGS